MSEPTYDEIMQDKDLAYAEAAKAGVVPAQPDGETSILFDLIWSAFSAAHNSMKHPPEIPDDRPV